MLLKKKAQHKAKSEDGLDEEPQKDYQMSN